MHEGGYHRSSRRHDLMGVGPSLKVAGCTYEASFNWTAPRPARESPDLRGLNTHFS